MINNPRLNLYFNALKGSEAMQNIASINLANSNTLGYKKLIGAFGPNECCNDNSFSDEFNNLKFNITRDTKEGSPIDVNGKKLEGSNVDATEELKKLVDAANMTRSIFAGLQIENRLNQEIINLGR